MYALKSIRYILNHRATCKKMVISIAADTFRPILPKLTAKHDFILRHVEYFLVFWEFS